jgi:hypothetical protein
VNQLVARSSVLQLVAQRTLLLYSLNYACIQNPYFDSGMIHSFIHLLHISVDPNTGTQHHRIWNVSNI